MIKVHLEAVRYAREGYTIFLIGHEGHDEVIGTMGEAPNQMILVETAEDVERLVVPDPDKVAYLTQTTLSVDDANIVIAALRRKFPNIANPPKDDICYATQNRQEAVRELAAQADLVLVLGSQNSSNSRRLAEIANGLGIPSHLIDGVSEIQHSWFADVETVLITAGASAPEQVVQECIEYLETQLRRDHPGRNGPQGKRPFPASKVATPVAARRNGPGRRGRLRAAQGSRVVRLHRQLRLNESGFRQRRRRTFGDINEVGGWATGGQNGRRSCSRFAAAPSKGRGESERRAKQVVLLIFAVHLFENSRALPHRRDHQRRHLDERDRPDQGVPVVHEHAIERPNLLDLQRPAGPQFVRWQKKSSQTMAPVAAIDRVDLSESRA